MTLHFFKTQPVLFSVFTNIMQKKTYKAKKSDGSPTLVEVGECFLVQFDCRRGRCTQNVLEGKDLVFIVWGQAGLLLLEDGQGENIAEKKINMLVRITLCWIFIVNTIWSDKHCLKCNKSINICHIYISLYLLLTIIYIYTMNCVTTTHALLVAEVQHCSRWEEKYRRGAKVASSVFIFPSN